MGKLVGIKDLERDADISLQEAREFECCKGLSDEEINELLEVLKIFSQVAYNLYAKQKLKKEQSNEELFQKYLKTVRQILEKDYDIYEYQIYYWACLENNKNEIDDCWKVTPMMRDLINAKK